jgi:hypothetical protein
MRLTRPIHVLKRRARQLSRELGIPLHAALDRVARKEGFRTWSHLSSHASAPHAARDLFTQLEPGDLILLAARPRQGKTVLGLELLVEALKAGRAASLFTLECTEQGVRAWLARTELDRRAVRSQPQIDTADDITADHIIHKLGAADPGTLVVVDYLQLLDRRRRDPELGEQLSALRAFTLERGLITVCLSQINRTFELSARTVPTFSDVLLPNPLDRELFSKGCFLHEGRMRLDRWN